MKLITILFSILICLQPGLSSAETKALPSPSQFDASKYAGSWYEVARFKTPVQPEGSLAKAEYQLKDGKVQVVNTAYDSSGKVMRKIEGKAIIEGGDKLGRLRVGFGPQMPAEANYCVLSVDKNYELALVGSPNRKSLWILSRHVPVCKQKIKELVQVASKAGFDTKKLVYAQWPDKFSKPSIPNLAGKWSFQITGPNGELVNMPMEIEVKGNILTGKIARNDDQWLEIKSGCIQGKTISFSIERDRPTGGVMIYKMSGTLEGKKLSGEVSTEFNGQDASIPWSATLKD